MLGLLIISAACGDGPAGPDSADVLSGRWEGTFQGVLRGVAVQLDLDPVEKGQITGTGRLGYTGVAVVLPVTGTYDPPLLQLIITGPDSTVFTMVGERTGSTIVGSALSTFSAPGIPGGLGDVTLNWRPAFTDGGSP